MKRFRKAVEEARIEWGIPGGLPFAKRVAWYQSFFISQDELTRQLLTDIDMLKFNISGLNKKL